MKYKHLPATRPEMDEAGWERPDFVLVTGDAYVDSPSFGTAIISRVLAERGYRVCVLPQPDWHTPADFKRFGRPKLGFLINSGNIDSMVNHYTAAKKRRSDDAYTEGGVSGRRPDRAVIVYTNLARQAYSNIPVVIGGVEASLRRAAHYDYWDDAVRRSVLFDSRADILSYGMGERSIVAIADLLAEGVPVNEITEIDGTAYISSQKPENCVEAPSFEEIRQSRLAYCDAYNITYAHSQRYGGKKLVQKHADRYVVINPPARPLERAELDAVYALPYTRLAHPMYKGHIPATDEVEFSITSCRGCFGGCSFCALAFHQGRVVTSRSIQSIVQEARQLTLMPTFKGYIHDVGGPTANFRRPACANQQKNGACPERNCLFPQKCKNLEVSHAEYRELLKKLRELDGVKRVFIRSGLRFDYMLYDRDDSFFYDLIRYHVSGQLKVAPEHVSPRVLELMGKPPVELFDRFLQKYAAINNSLGLKQYIVPYFMSSHPGSDMNCAIELACYMKKNNIRPEQVQDFYPTPATLSTAMFYTGLDPRTKKPVYVPKSYKEKQLQRALLQYYKPANAPLVREALRLAERDDLIGYDKRCLAAPERQTARKEGNYGKADARKPRGRANNKRSGRR